MTPARPSAFDVLLHASTSPLKETNPGGRHIRGGPMVLEQEAAPVYRHRANNQALQIYTEQLRADQSRVAMQFVALVMELSEALPDIAIRTSRRRKGLDRGDYTLASVMHHDPFLQQWASLEPTGRSCCVEPAAITRYDPNRPEHGGRPYLDTRHAVGLVHKGVLAAIAGAGVGGPGVLKIKQIQDVSGTQGGHPDFKHNGLQQQSGLAWPHTLLRVWELIAEQTGVRTVVVQSAVNNPWFATSEQAEKLYDRVADDMGYRYDPLSSDWYKHLY